MHDTCVAVQENLDTASIALPADALSTLELICMSVVCMLVLRHVPTRTSRVSQCLQSPSSESAPVMESTGDCRLSVGGHDLHIGKLKFGDDLVHSLGHARGRRKDVLRRTPVHASPSRHCWPRPSSTESRSPADRSHKLFDQAELFMHLFGQRRHAVGRTRGVGHHCVKLGRPCPFS